MIHLKQIKTGEFRDNHDMLVEEATQPIRNLLPGLNT